MAKVILSPKALQDIDFIAEYISLDSIESANIFVKRLIQSTDGLEDFPYSGRIIKELDDDYSREIIISSYRIMYKIDDDIVIISSIVHSDRNWYE